MKFLRVTAISEEKTASDGRLFKTVSFVPVTVADLGDGKLTQVLSNRRPIGRNIWQSGPNGSAGDGIYDKVTVGSMVEGEVLTAQVDPYQIGENTVTTYSAVVFPYENFDTLIQRQQLSRSSSVSAPAVQEEVAEDLTA